MAWVLVDRVIKGDGDVDLLLEPVGEDIFDDCVVGLPVSYEMGFGSTSLLLGGSLWVWE